MMKRPVGSAHDLSPRILGGFEVAHVEPERPSIWRAVVRRVLGFLVVLVILAVLFVAGSDLYVRGMAAGRTHVIAEELPDGLPALVLGTSPKLSSGMENSYFRGRMEAAADLYKKGKASFIIVSGDNRTENYNEPRAMNKALMELGVPGDKIHFDFAGLRTLDSVVRVKEVFGQNKVIVVSQKFHNQRAVCLARHFDIEAYGYNASGEVDGFNYWKNWVRERMARVLMLLDLYLFDTQPKHLGPPVPVPGSEPPQTSQPPQTR